MTIAIIGSGIGGIALATRLGTRGHDVHVFDTNSRPGGKLHSFNLGEYRFDGGPSLFTMPQYVEEVFQTACKEMNGRFSYKSLDTACHYFWEDGFRFEAPVDPALFSKNAAEVFDTEEKTVIQYFNRSKSIYDKSARIFLEKPIHELKSWLSREVLLALPHLRKFNLLANMHGANQRQLKEPHLVQLFDRFATYNGSNPYKAPGMLNVIPWFEHGFGTYFPKGGMQQIAQSIYDLAIEMDVEFHFKHEVESIVVEKGKAVGIMIGGKELRFDLIVSNADVHQTYRRLLADEFQPKRLLNQEPSSSAVVFYWGIAGEFKSLGLHNIFFSGDYKKEFDCLFKKGELSDDPTVYINITSKHESGDAPAGCENWFVMINAPADTGQDWEAEVLKARDNIIKKLSRLLEKDIEPMIAEEKSWSPAQIAADTGSFRGSLYGNSSNSKMAAFMRQSNRSKTIKNLYFCGGSVHPGGGIPLALLSAKITDELIAKA